MKAILKKSTITNENFHVYKKESIYEDVLFKSFDGEKNW